LAPLKHIWSQLLVALNARRLTRRHSLDAAALPDWDQLDQALGSWGMRLFPDMDWIVEKWSAIDEKSGPPLMRKVVRHWKSGPPLEKWSAIGSYVEKWSAIQDAQSQQSYLAWDLLVPPMSLLGADNWVSRYRHICMEVCTIRQCDWWEGPDSTESPTQSPFSSAPSAPRNGLEKAIPFCPSTCPSPPASQPHECSNPLLAPKSKTSN
jgi:hypothetical protein